MKELLKESYQTTRRMTGVDPSKPGALKQVLLNDKAFDIYARSLCEGIAQKDRKSFMILAQNTRKTLLENSMYQLNPYETLALPLLRVFFPKTIAKDLVTVIPMDKPEIVRSFIRATFTKQAGGNLGPHEAPSNTDISSGPSISVPIVSAAAVGQIDVLNLAGLTDQQAYLEKTFKITGFVDDSGQNCECDITPTVDGEFSATVTTSNDVTDVITGRINYLTGKVDVVSVAGKVSAIAFSGTASLEQNEINPIAKLQIDKLRLFAKDRQIQTEWSVQMEQDVKALYNVDIQAELVSVIGQQIVMDIDREIVNSLAFACERLAGASHTDTFHKVPPSEFHFGPKAWQENILPKLNELSAAVYRDTNMAAANTIACNPLDATILESLQEFRYNGKSDVDGDLGYESATVANGKWNVLVSPIVTEGQMLLVYKPVEEIRSVFIFAPYVPSVLSPYPLGKIPSLTVLSRYGSQLIRPKGIAVLNIHNHQE